MKKVMLVTKEVERSMPALYSQEHNADPKVVCKFFTPDANWTWYVTEGEKQEDGDWLFFGLVDGHEKELGYFTLSEIQSVRGGLGLPVERDRYFGDHNLSEFKS